MNSCKRYLALFIFIAILSSCKKEQLVLVGNKLARTENANDIQRFKYDSLGRLISILNTEHTQLDTIKYDATGRMNQYFDGYSLYQFHYNSLGQIVKKVSVYHKFTIHDSPDTSYYRYDQKGRLIETETIFVGRDLLTHPGWIRNYKYDDHDNIVEYVSTHQYYSNNGSWEDKMSSYDDKINPYHFSNSILYFLNEFLFDALNKNNVVKRKDNLLIMQILW